MDRNMFTLYVKKSIKFIILFIVRILKTTITIRMSSNENIFVIILVQNLLYENSKEDKTPTKCFQFKIYSHAYVQFNSRIINIWTIFDSGHTEICLLFM